MDYTCGRILEDYTCTYRLFKNFQRVLNDPYYFIHYFKVLVRYSENLNHACASQLIWEGCVKFDAKGLVDLAFCHFYFDWLLENWTHSFTGYIDESFHQFFIWIINTYSTLTTVLWNKKNSALELSSKCVKKKRMLPVSF